MKFMQIHPSETNVLTIQRRRNGWESGTDRWINKRILLEGKLSISDPDYWLQGIVKKMRKTSDVILSLGIVFPDAEYNYSTVF